MTLAPNNYVFLSASAYGPPSPGSIQSYKYVAADQSFSISLTGLMPSTLHTVSVNSEDVTADCRPAGGQLGDSLVTDSSGRMTFTYYFNVTTGTPVTDSQNIQALINGVASALVMSITNGAGTSKATVTIPVVNINSGAILPLL
jgi:hypothetical protein